jgi:hypothetical protein
VILQTKTNPIQIRSSHLVSQVQSQLLRLLSALVAADRVNPKRPDEVSVGLLLAHEYHLSENFGGGSSACNDTVSLKGSDSVLHAVASSLQLKLGQSEDHASKKKNETSQKAKEKEVEEHEEEEDFEETNVDGMPCFSFVEPVARTKSLQRVQTNMDSSEEEAQPIQKISTALSHLRCHLTPVVIKTEASQFHEEKCHQNCYVFPFSSLEFALLESKISQEEYLQKRPPIYEDAVIPFVGTAPNPGAIWYQVHKQGKPAFR